MGRVLGICVVYGRMPKLFAGWRRSRKGCLGGGLTLAQAGENKTPELRHRACRNLSSGEAS